MTLLIYGAGGFTGRLILRQAALRNLPCIAAARKVGSLSSVEMSQGSEVRVFSLEDPRHVDEALAGVGTVLNCAGPFGLSAPALVEACLRNRIHYLDISGEAGELDAMQRYAEDAEKAGVTVLPGAGFDVVPADCLVAELKHRMPGIRRVTVGFDVKGGASRGTIISSIQTLPRGGLVVRDGELKSTTGYMSRAIDYGDEIKGSISVSWGELISIRRSTGIPNIEIFMAMPSAMRAGLNVMSWIGRTNPLHKAMLSLAKKAPPGPNAQERAAGSSRIVAEGVDERNGCIRLRFNGPDPYDLTALTALELAIRAERGTLPVGLQTPSLACGYDFTREFPGVRIDELARSGCDVRLSPS